MRLSHPRRRPPEPDGPVTVNVHKLRGFTLIEILVAIFVFAIMFAIGYGAISAAAQHKAGIATAETRLRDIQNTMRWLSLDFTQLVSRPVRDLPGSGEEAALRIDPRNNVLANLTRGGWRNSAGIARSSLQRVNYLLDNGQLVRLEWPVLDAAQSAIPRRRALLDKVRSVTVRAMNMGRQWTDSWPPASVPANSANLRLRPLAVEIIIETEDFGTLRRVIEVPG